MAITRKRPIDHAAMRMECLALAVSACDHRGPIALAEQMYTFVTSGAVPLPLPVPPIRTTKRVPAKPASRG
jgi:hypothetical protein